MKVYLVRVVRELFHPPFGESAVVAVYDSVEKAQTYCQEYEDDVLYEFGMKPRPLTWSQYKEYGVVLGQRADSLSPGSYIVQEFEVR